MKYGNLRPTYLVTATINKAVEYHYVLTKEEADRLEIKLTKQGYITKQTPMI